MADYADRVSTIEVILLAANVSEDAAIALAIEAGLIDANDYEGSAVYEEAREELAEEYPDQFGDDDDEDES
jgi:hypothetical protein